MMLYMVIIMSTAIIGTFPQFKKNSTKGIGWGFLGFLTFAMAMFPFQSGDFIHMAISFQTNTGLQHYEDFFIWLWEITDNIILWRAVIYGGSTLFLIGTIKLLNVNSKFSAFIFVITQMFMFGALRNMLGLTAMFFCIALFFYAFYQNKNIILLVIACVGLYFCIYLHRSMWLYLLLLIPAVIPFGKKIIRLSIFTFPFLYISVFILSAWFLSSFGDAEAQQHASYYTESERATTLMKTINELLKLGAYLYLLHIIFRYIRSRRYQIPIVFKFLARYAYILIYIGFLFYGQGTGDWLFERFTWTGEMALMFSIMWFYYFFPRTRNVRIAFGILLYQILYQILYICTYASSGYISRFNTITL